MTYETIRKMIPKIITRNTLLVGVEEHQRKKEAHIMPYIKYQNENMLTMRQLAALVGIPSSRFWRLVRDEGAIDAPAIRAGRREYYDDTQVARVVEQVARLRETGTLA